MLIHTHTHVHTQMLEMRNWNGKWKQLQKRIKQFWLQLFCWQQKFCALLLQLHKYLKFNWNCICEACGQAASETVERRNSEAMVRSKDKRLPVVEINAWKHVAHTHSPMYMEHGKAQKHCLAAQPVGSVDKRQSCPAGKVHWERMRWGHALVPITACLFTVLRALRNARHTHIHTHMRGRTATWTGHRWGLVTPTYASFLHKQRRALWAHSAYALYGLLFIFSSLLSTTVAGYGTTACQ